MQIKFLKIGAILGALSVALGAFGAHGLKQIVSSNALSVFETAVRYQFYHVFALFITGILYKEIPSKWMIRAGNFFILGMLLFCGSLYALTFIMDSAHGSLLALGMITPIGGLCFILGWVFLAYSFFRSKQSIHN